MGLHHTAHYLKSKGRGNDTMLVHMTPSEVKGLQALAMAKGGSLTINPQTGLPEAGFLEDILPVVAAAGLTYLTAGAAAPALGTAFGLGTTASGIAAGALSGAAISGLTAAATGKDAGQAALMGGLGGGIAGGLGAYTEAPNLLADISQKTATTAGTEAGTQLAQAAADASTASTLNTATGLPTTPQFSYSPSGELIPAGTGAAPVGVGAAPGAPGMPITSSNTELLEQMARGQGVFPEGSPALPGGAPNTQALFDAEAAARGGASRTIGVKPDTFYQDQGTIGRMAIQGLPAYGLIGDQEQTTPQDDYVSPLKRLSPNFQAYVPPQPNPYYRAQYPVYGAEGGEIKLAAGGQPSGPVERMSMMGQQPGMYPQGMINPTAYATPSQRPASMEVVRSDYDTPVNPITGIGPQFNTGGVPRALPKGDAGTYIDRDPTTSKQDAFTAAMTRLGATQKRANIKGLPALKAAAKPLGNVEEMASGGLGGYSDGGRMLKGPGDGMSDSIPGVIGGRQPARLADGEFVVPADVVSHLGNGSTDAGARKLYKMMDKIRKARTGRKKQAPAVKADKYMPA
jgi:hypothetical protein